MTVMSMDEAQAAIRKRGVGAIKLDPRRNEPPSYERLNETPPPLREKTIPNRELALAILLTSMGAFLLIIGAIVFSRKSLYDSVPFTGMGLVTFVPGFYHAFIMIMIKRGEPGFTYDMLGRIDGT